MRTVIPPDLPRVGAKPLFKPYLTRSLTLSLVLFSRTSDPDYHLFRTFLLLLLLLSPFTPPTPRPTVDPTGVRGSGPSRPDRGPFLTQRPEGSVTGLTDSVLTPSFTLSSGSFSSPSSTFNLGLPPGPTPSRERSSSVSDLRSRHVSDVYFGIQTLPHATETVKDLG